MGKTFIMLGIESSCDETAAAIVREDGTVVLVTNAGGILTSHDGGQTFSLRFLPDRESISAILPRKAGGVLVAGQGGVRVIEDVK